MRPHQRTVATARTIGRIDKVARALLHACWFVINAALWLTVATVLWLERTKRVLEDPLRPGYVQIGKDWFFRCMWCGSLTAEIDEYRLTCCAMEARRWFENEMARR